MHASRNRLRPRGGRYVLWLVLAVPFFWIGYRYATGGLFYGEVLHLSGEFAARLLILTLAVTPLGLLFPRARWTRWLASMRRYLGIGVFAYAALHTIVYLDRKQSLSLILDEARDFSMWTGWVALLIFLLLAATSNDRAVRLLRRGWKKLHRWIYAATLLTFLHWIFAAFDYLPGVIHLLVVAALESIRLLKSRTGNSQAT